LGGDGATRRPLLAEQKRLRKALKGEATDEERLGLRAELQAVLKALQAMKTSLHVVEPTSSRS
jgi:hypothetical protein